MGLLTMTHSGRRSETQRSHGCEPGNEPVPTQLFCLLEEDVKYAYTTHAPALSTNLTIKGHQKTIAGNQNYTKGQGNVITPSQENIILLGVGYGGDPWGDSLGWARKGGAHLCQSASPQAPIPWQTRTGQAVAF